MGRYAQSLEPAYHSGRFVRRRRRFAGSRPRDARDRQRHGRLDPHSGEPEWPLWLQAPRTVAFRWSRAEVMPQGTSGPLARSLEDLALLQSAINGPHPRQLSALRPQMSYPASYADIRGMKIAFGLNQGWAVLEPDVRRNTEQALKLLESQGAILEEVALAWDSSTSAPPFRKRFCRPEWARSCNRSRTRPGRRTPHQLRPAFYEGTRRGRRAAPARRSAALCGRAFQAIRRPVRQRLPGLRLSDRDHHPRSGRFRVHASKLLVDGKEVDPFAGWVVTPQFNLIYTIPVVNVPTGLADNRVPTGMQVAARSFDDLTAFRVASAYAAAAPRLFTGDLMPDFRNSA